MMYCIFSFELSPVRFVFVVQGTVTLTNVSDVNHKLMVSEFH